MAFTWFSEKTIRRMSPIEGTGLFAAEMIPAGALVVVKGGHVMTRAERDRIAIVLGPTEIQIDDHLFIGPLHQGERAASMMYLNHSCDPNVGFRGEISFVAMRDILLGEEITLEYATGDDDDYVLHCNCGSEGCRRRITGKDWLLETVQARYAGWFAPYLARRIRALSDG